MVRFSSKHKNEDLAPQHGPAELSGEVDFTTRVESFAGQKVVMFLGQTCSGKSTVIRILCKTADIEAIENPVKPGELRIAGEGIGQGLVSTTILPERHKGFKEKINFCDCPGSEDQRVSVKDPKLELKQLSYVRQVAMTAKALKFIVVVDHSCMSLDKPVQKFLEAIEYAVDLLACPELFHGACLLVNKVQVSHRFNERGLPVMIGDTEVLGGIRNYLQSVLVCLKGGDILKDEDAKCSSFQNLLQYILNKDSILLFRRPSRCGPVSQDPVIKDTRQTVKHFLVDQKSWVEDPSYKVMGFPLSSKARIAMMDVLHEKQKYFSKLRVRMVEDAKVEYKELVKNKAFIFNQELPIKEEDIQAFQLAKSHIRGELKWLQGATQEDIVSPEINKVEEEISTWHKYFVNLWKEIHNFMNLLIAKVWSYDVQKEKAKYNVEDVRLWGLGSSEMKGKGINVNEKNLVLFLTILKYHEDRFSNCNLNAISEFAPVLLQWVNALFQLALQTEVEITINKHGEVVVDGICVVLSLVVNELEKCYEEYRRVTIFARATLFVDADVNAVGRKLNLAIVAPYWNIRKSCCFNLDGENGRPRVETKPGTEGEPGLPGGPGGYVFCSGCLVENGSLLTVSVRGGRGGCGGQGSDGESGMDAKEVVPMPWDSSEKAKHKFFSFRLLWNVWGRTHVGSSGGRGSDGYEGGKGGAAGIAGSVDFHCNMGTSGIVVRQHQGVTGPDGEVGRRGRNGKSSSAKHSDMLFILFLPVWFSSRVAEEKDVKTDEVKNEEKERVHRKNITGIQESDQPNKYSRDEKLALLKSFNKENPNFIDFMEKTRQEQMLALQGYIFYELSMH